MDSRSFRVLSLFSGIAGLDLGIRLALPIARTVCFVEGEAYCAAQLVARMQDGSLHDAPIWTDVRNFQGKPWRGAVDCIVGGFPCQDLSYAGKGVGLSGERSGLWREYRRIICEVRPEYVFVENVPALLARGIDRVLGDLAEAGYDAAWGVFSAKEVGAPHKRERLFILAHRHQSGLETPRTEQQSAGTSRSSQSMAHARRAEWGQGYPKDRRDSRSHDTNSCGPEGSVGARQCREDVVDSQCVEGGCSMVSEQTRGVPIMGDPGGEQRNSRKHHSERGCVLPDKTWQDTSYHQEGARCEYRFGTGSDDVGNSDFARLEGYGLPRQRSCELPTGSASSEVGVGLFPPKPSDREAWARVLAEHPELAPAVERKVCGVADGDADGMGETRSTRTDELRALGNAVVPACAAVAFTTLYQALAIRYAEYT